MLWWTLWRLKSSKTKRRLKAVDRLGGSRNPRVVPALVAVALDDDNREVRREAARALEEIGDVRAVELLVAALGSGDTPVREAAAQALWRIGDVRAIEPLISALEDESEIVRERTANALVKTGFAAVSALVNVLDHGDADVRRRASEALGKIGDARAAEKLIHRLRDENSDVRLAAAKALEALKESPGDAADRAAFAVALRNWDEAADLGPTAVEPLAAALGAREPLIRKGAEEALVRIGSPEAVKALIDTLGSEDKLLREEAVDALKLLRWEPANDVERALRAVARQRWEDAVACGRDAVGPLVLALRDKEGEIRQAAATALGEIGDPSAVEALVNVLADDDSVARRIAVEALGKVGDVHAVAPLVATLKDDKAEVREAAVTALARVGADAVPALIEVLNDDDWLMHALAARALGEIGDPRALKPLLKILTDGRSETRRAVAEALGRLGSPQAIEALVAAAKDESHGVKQAVLLALGEIGDVRALKPLIAHVSDPSMALVAVTGLTKLLRRNRQACRTEDLRSLASLPAVVQFAYDSSGRHAKNSRVAGRFEVDCSVVRLMAWEEWGNREPEGSVSFPKPQADERVAVFCNCGREYAVSADTPRVRTTCPKCGNIIVVVSPERA